MHRISCPKLSSESTNVWPIILWGEGNFISNRIWIYNGIIEWRDFSCMRRRANFLGMLEILRQIRYRVKEVRCHFWKVVWIIGPFYSCRWRFLKGFNIYLKTVASFSSVLVSEFRKYILCRACYMTFQIPRAYNWVGEMSCLKFNFPHYHNLRRIPSGGVGFYDYLTVQRWCV